jgi:tRNA threonylcarbamoyladenosine biosynthesis protein TsaE
VCGADAETADLTRELPGEAETEVLGAEIGRMLRRGDVVCLRGDLGAGKTTLVRGIHAALGCTGRVRSPSFATLIEYEGDPPLRHFDLFRYEVAGEGFLDEFDEWISGDGVTVIEWADRLGDLAPADRLDVTLAVAGAGRTARIGGRGRRGRDLVARLGEVRA